jgi:excisionase family DNA binding protein
MTHTTLQDPAAPWRSRAAISVEEAGELLGVCRSTAYTAARSGDIPSIRIGKGRILVPVLGLRRLLGEMD